MAKSKSKNAPKGIDDQIIGGIRAIMSPWLGTPPAQNNKVTQAQGLARGAAQTLDQTFAGGMIGAGVKGNKALAQQAALNAAYAAGGYGAGKVVSKAAGALVESGLPNRLKNTLLNQSVVVHGTKYPIKGTEINTNFGSNAAPKENVVFGWNPNVRTEGIGISGDLRFIREQSAEYSQRPLWQKATGQTVPGKGNVVVGTVKNKGIVKNQVVVKSNNPIKINEVVNSRASDYQKTLEQALRRQGIRVKPNLSEIRAAKKEAVALAKRKRNAPPSPV